MWFTPEPINYYYYGHYVTAYLTKLSGLSSAFTFNIMLATIFALCFSSTFSIGANLFQFAIKKINNFRFTSKVIIAGVLTALVTTLGGNLHILYSFFKAYPNEKPQPMWELPFLPATFPNAYWYPNATRFIFNTIHEFPIYSWVVADLHGHVLDIPFVLFIIGLLLAIFMKAEPSPEDELTDEKWLKSWIIGKRMKNFTAQFVIHPLLIVLIGFLLAVMYMTNAWDGAIYLLLTALVIFYLLWENLKKNSEKFHWLFIVRLLVPIILVMVTFLTFAFPYNYFFKPFASGIGVLCAPDFLTNIKTTKFFNITLTEDGKVGPFLFEKDHCQHSYWWELVTLYGFFYFFVFSFIIYLTFSKKITRADSFILVLITMGTLLIVLPEFIYVKDIYPAHFRANTMFKLVFQAFIMLSIVSVYVIARIAQTRFRFVFLPFAFILIALVMTYPYLAVNSYYGELKTYKGLHGTEYLHTLYPDDYAGILWLNAYVKNQPVILEAQGDSYTDYGRVSSNTGLPTVLGWTVHEWLWRGDYGIPAPRIEEVKNLYESSDLSLTKDLINKHDIQYVFIGKLEYDKYPKLNEKKFQKLGKVVFEKNETKIYEITQ
jgi:YYY domain-containing protein